MADAIGFWALLDVLEARSSQARAIEAEHGAGTFLNLEHRLVRDLIDRGQVQTTQQVDAARRLRDDQPNFVSDWFGNSVMNSSSPAAGPTVTSSRSSYSGSLPSLQKMHTDAPSSSLPR